MAFNLQDKRILPYPRRASLDAKSIQSFCAAFLSGRLKTAADAQRALVLLKNPDQKLIPKLYEQEKQLPEKVAFVKGVTEDFHDWALPSLTETNFTDVAMHESSDVVVLFHVQVRIINSTVSYLIYVRTVKLVPT